MRPKVLIPIAVLFLATLSILFWLPQKHYLLLPKTTPEATKSASLNSNAPLVIQKAINQPQGITAPIASQLPVINDREKTNEIRQFLESQNKPIEFFGKIVDQDGNPLFGVKIKGEVLHVKVIVPAAWGSQDEINPIEKDTDQNGRFAVQNVVGRALQIEAIQKDGFEVEPEYCPRSFGSSVGEYENPTIFKMWNTNIHEQLVTGEKKIQIMPDGRPYFIDFTEGTITESGKGDLKVWIQYTNQPVHGQFSDWSAKIDVLNGGLSESDSYSMFSAPTEGYVPSFIWKNQIKGGQRGSIGNKKFYVMLNNGKVFGRIQIDLIAPFNDQTPGLIRLSYAINPSGSRILR